MINKESIVSAFNDRGTLLKWLIMVNDKLDNIEAMRRVKCHKLTIRAKVSGDSFLTVRCGLLLTQNERLTDGQYIHLLYNVRQMLYGSITNYNGTVISAYINLYIEGGGIDSAKIEFNTIEGIIGQGQVLAQRSQEFGRLKYESGVPIFELTNDGTMEVEVVEI